MEAQRRLLDDLAKMATSAAGVVQGAGQEMEQMFRQRFERLLDSMNLVTREEFDAVKAMAEAARLENEALAKELENLKKGMTAKPRSKAAKPATTKSKAAAAKTAKSAGSKAKTATTKTKAATTAASKTAAAKRTASKTASAKTRAAKTAAAKTAAGSKSPAAKTEAGKGATTG
ncbi:MAG: accessory factor UbiK family protein [Alphaproteobacteria bacterium]|jgi:hypothetical protein|nr:accessory factor UbiK family protein [Alphaproteobacteria bacterium]